MRKYCGNQSSPEWKWYNRDTGTYSRTKDADTDVFCGLPEEFFMSESCMSDMQRYNAYMEQHRYEFFNVREGDGRRIAKDRDDTTYNECTWSNHPGPKPLRGHFVGRGLRPDPSAPPPTPPTRRGRPVG